MSRCFPYPPPAYVKNGIRDEALIESIKKEVEKAKKEKKRHRRHEKKDRVTTKKNGEVEIKKHNKKRGRDDRSSIDQQSGDKENTRQIKVGHLERSVVTEEHGHPVGSQISTDSTYNINKRLKQQHPSVNVEVHNPGSIIRIKLPAQMHKDPDVLPKEQPCSSCKRMQNDVSAPKPGIDMAELCCSTSAIFSHELNFRPFELKSCPTSAGAEETSSNGLAGKSLATELKDLVENLLPPPVPEEWTIPDLGWLFETKQSNNRPTGRCSRSSMERKFPRLESSNPWPCAEFLPDADVYALPYSIPF